MKKMAGTAFALLTSALLVDPACPDSVQWVPLPIAAQETQKKWGLGGEGGQIIQQIEIDPADGNFLIMGCDVGGLYRSENGGDRWYPCNIGFDARGVSALAIDPNNGSRILAAGGNVVAGSWNGLYLSTDRGWHWSPVFPLKNLGGAGRLEDMFEKLAYDASTYDPEEGYTRVAYWSHPGSDSAEKSIYKSPDGGRSWQIAHTGLGGGILEVHPTEHSVYYADSTGFYRSDDGGLRFTLVQEGNFTGMDLVPSAPDLLWLCTPTEVLRSDDGGHTLARIHADSEKNYHLIKISPAHPERMIIGHQYGAHYWFTDRYLSTDGGRSWTSTQNIDHADNIVPESLSKRRIIATWHPEDEQIVYSTGGDFITKSADGGLNWAWHNAGNNGILVGRTFNFSMENPDILGVGFQDWGYGLSLDRGESWAWKKVEHPWGDHIYGGFAARATLLFGGDADSWEAPRRLKISYDEGATWVDKGIDLQGYEISYQSPVDPDLLFCFEYRSADAGQTWSKMAGCDGVHTHDPLTSALYGRNGGDLVGSTDGGATWEKIAAVPEGNILDIAVARDAIYLTSDQTIFRDEYQTADNSRLLRYDVAKETLTDLYDILPRDQFNTIRPWSVAVDPQNPNIIYVANVKHIYNASNCVVRSRDGGVTWEIIAGHSYDFGAAQPTEAFWLRVHPITRELYVAAHNHGLWKLAAPNRPDTDR